MSAILRKVLEDQRDMLLFRRFRPELAQHRWAYLAWGLLVTWIVGMARYWDHPNAEPWQYWGLGSVAYVFALALVLWIMVRPLRPRNWSYGVVLTFVTLTSLPALLYAIPVEEFMTPENAATANSILLLIVASWRVALLIVFLRRAAGLPWDATIVAALLPLTIIVAVLGLLGLEKAAVHTMSGHRTRPAEPAIVSFAAYEASRVLTNLSMIAAPILAVIFLVMVSRVPLDGEDP